MLLLAVKPFGFERINQFLAIQLGADKYVIPVIPRHRESTGYRQTKAVQADALGGIRGQCCAEYISA